MRGKIKRIPIPASFIPGAEDPSNPNADRERVLNLWNRTPVMIRRWISAHPSCLRRVEAIGSKGILFDLGEVSIIFSPPNSCFVRKAFVYDGYGRLAYKTALSLAERVCLKSLPRKNPALWRQTGFKRSVDFSMEAFRAATKKMIEASYDGWGDIVEEAPTTQLVFFQSVAGDGYNEVTMSAAYYRKPRFYVNFEAGRKGSKIQDSELYFGPDFDEAWRIYRKSVSLLSKEIPEDYLEGKYIDKVPLP